MNIQSIKDVGLSIQKAIKVFKFLPDERAGGYFNCWPTIVRDQKQSMKDKSDKILPKPVRPNSIEIDEAYSVLDWFSWLEIDERHLVWQKCSGKAWNEISRTRSRISLWRDYNMALSKIYRQLKKGGI